MSSAAQSVPMHVSDGDYRDWRHPIPTYAIMWTVQEYLHSRPGIVPRFRYLTDMWTAETLDMSSVTDITSHPAYMQIIGMGPAVIPLILDELESESNHWYVALSAITGHYPPIAENDAGNLDRLREIWFQWARETGYR
jgi:hypothetical protein